MVFDNVPDLADANAEWFSSVLVNSGAAPVGARAVAVRQVPLSAGRLASTTRFHLTWADENHRGPASVVGKFPAAGDRSRRTGFAADAYAMELAFYTRVAPTVRIEVPRCHFAADDPVAGRFALVLADVAPVRTVDQVVGADPDDVAAALVALAGLHAQYWDRSQELSGLPLRAPKATVRRLAAAYRLLHRDFLERFGGRLSDGAVEMVTRCDSTIRGWRGHDRPPYTLLHGDYRVDNLLFPVEESAEVTVVDWQNLGVGSPAADVAYLIGGSLRVDVRRASEKELTQVYTRALAANGVEVVEPEFGESYRVSALTGLLMTVVCAMLVDDRPDGDALFLTMAERHTAHVEDLDAS
jgi:aminoglycoside/choline kinase family phosphotransferase